MTDVKGRQIETTASTQIEMKNELKSKKLQPFYWIQANEQSQGRGRQDKSWVSEPGNLYLSIFVPESLVKYDFVPVTWLPIRTALCAVSTLSYLGVFSSPVQVRWPNDLVVKDKTNFKKLGGIIVEQVSGKGIQSGFIIGIGINVVSSPAQGKGIDQPTVFLNEILKPECNLIRIRNEILAAIQVELSSSTTVQKLRARLKQVEAYPEGSKINWHGYEGIVQGYGEHGELLVKTPDGKSKSLLTEEIQSQ
jgi:BirA family biotin operon repressor/biotin-[acetyl-CoA-carboxylase] ligase